MFIKMKGKYRADRSLEEGILRFSFDQEVCTALRFELRILPQKQTDYETRRVLYHPYSTAGTNYQKD